MSNSENQIQAVDAAIVVPLQAPFVKLPKPKPDQVQNGTVEIRFPNQCAWCGQGPVAGIRIVEVYEDNPAYQRKGKRFLKEGVGLAVGAAIGGVGGTTMIGATRSEDLIKIKGWRLKLSVPYCVAHTDTPPEGTFALVNGRIQVRDAGYARLIARVNNSTIQISTLENFRWPEQCLICGTSSVNQKYDAGAGQLVPVCGTDRAKIVRSQQANKRIFQIGFVIAFLVGGLTLLANTSLGGHIALFLCGGLTGLAVWLVVAIALASRLIGVSQMPWQPVRIVKMQDSYQLTFENLEMAELVRQMNHLDQ